MHNKKEQSQSIEINTFELSEIIFYSFRYALGRKTYVVSDVVEKISKYWNDIDEKHQRLIIKEIEDAIAMNNYGMEMDLKEWQKVLVKGREFCRKPDIDEMIKGILDNGR